MSRRLLLAILCVSALALSAAEIPLGASSPGPGDNMGTIGAVSSGDGFLVLRWKIASSYTKSHIYASRLSADGKPLDAAPLLIASTDDPPWAQDFQLALEGDRPVLTVKTFIPEKPGDWSSLDYQVKRMTLDASDGHVVDMTMNVHPDNFDVPGPKNSRGETLKITDGNGRQTVWFVGTDDVPRKPTPLDAVAGPVLSFVPYGDNEWLILCNANRGLVWYRMSEAKRGTPWQQTFDLVYPAYADNWRWKRQVATADGDFAILTEEDSTTYSSQRDLTLRIIRADGYSAKYALIAKEILTDLPWTPLSPASAALAKDGNAWLVAYSWFGASGRQELRVWRVDGKATLTKVETFYHFGDLGATAPVLVAGATRNLLLFRRARDYSNDHAHDMYSQTWDRGAPVPVAANAELVSTGLPPQRTPSAIATPGGVLAVWREGDTRGDVMLRFGEQVTRISSQIADARSPSIARNGDTIAVAWLEVRYDPRLEPNRQHVVVRRFDATGIAIDSAPLVIADSVTMPYVLRVSIGAEGDGFRVAWNGRSQQQLSAGARAAQTVYTTHLGAGGESIATIEELTPPYLAAGQPTVLAHGPETLLLWLQSDGVYAKRYVNAKEVRSSTQKLMSGNLYAAAVHDDELLLATAQYDAQLCTNAQRFSTSGDPLSPVVTIACSRPPRIANDVSVAWDAGRWWVAPASFRLTDVYEVNANGTPVDTAQFFAPDVNPESLSLIATGSGPSVVYVRSDAAASTVDRAFLHTFPRAKARSVRP